jgi:diguanylate cyclase (GGDEF)-like protein
MSPDLAPNLQGLLLQAVGVAPLAVLSFLLSRSLRRTYLRFWWWAWTSLAAALFSLVIGISLPAARPLLEPVHFFGQYAFAYWMMCGCRALVSGRNYGSRAWLLVAAAAATALGLSRAHAEFGIRLIPHAALMATLFALALREVRLLPAADRRHLGVRLLQLSLLALIVSSSLYVAILSWSAWTGSALSVEFSVYTPLLDLLLETLLGFGTLIVVMERERQELQDTNAELGAARERLELLARLDPLTNALNRHAFYSMVDGTGSVDGISGCVAVADVDALKSVNDDMGHAAGDLAIRAVARAIRQVVRADDLVYRWGGDEFLVVLFGVTEDEVRRRLDALTGVLQAVALSGSRAPVAISVSSGVAAFESLAGLEKAIETADARMYEQKQAKRSGSHDAA